MKSAADETRRTVVSDVMSSPVVTVPMEAPVKLVAELMLTRGVSAVPVVAANGRVVGIISEADLLLKEIAAVTGAKPRLLEGPRARQLRNKREALTAYGSMTTPVLTVHPQTTLRDAAKLMYEKRIKRLPVVDGSSLVGIVSRADLLRAFLIPDTQLHRRVERALHAWLGRDGAGVHVAVKEGTVTRSGETATHTDADIIGRLVARADGVLSVENRLDWRVDDLLAAECRRAAHV